MKFRIASILTTLLVLPLLFTSTRAQHQLMASPMPDMMHNMTDMKTSDCLSACGGQLQPTVAAINSIEINKEKEAKPQPTEPYYTQFLEFAPYVVLVSAAYLLKYMRWRPPDLIVLYGTYRT